MCACGHRHSIFCVLPPYMMDSILKNGSEEQKRAAVGTKGLDTTFRGMRAQLAAAVPLEIRRRRVLGTPPVKQRIISTADNQEGLPGRLVRVEGGAPVGDAAVDEAYDGLGATYDFFWDVFQRDSLDDEGRPLAATVHFGDGYNNAFWDGRRMVFGDGDGTLFNRFTLSLDVIAHELGHAITEDETGLVYLLQPGALNEHLSDVWGTLIKQWALNQTVDQADWLIGAELLADGVEGEALRSMKAPGTAFDDPVLGKDPQPAHMDDFVDTWQDNGGVHINSGIPNKAFYLAASGFGGHAWDKAGPIWYAAIRDARVTEGTKFGDFALVTIDLAGRLPGFGPADAKVVAEAWAKVGIVPTS